MSNPAELAKLIQVIHREPGFLRLELPAELCGAAAATAIEQGMLKLSGLQSAAVDRNWQRISLRYDATACSTPQVARHLFGLLDDLPLSETETDDDLASRSTTTSASAASREPCLAINALFALTTLLPDFSAVSRLANFSE